MLFREEIKIERLEIQVSIKDRGYILLSYFFGFCFKENDYE